MAFEQTAPFQPLPQGRAREHGEAREAVVPLAEEDAEAQQQIEGQQLDPHLPTHGVGVVAEKVSQSVGLLEFLEGQFDAPPASIKANNGLGAPGQVVGEGRPSPAAGRPPRPGPPPGAARPDRPYQPPRSMASNRPAGCAHSDHAASGWPTGGWSAAAGRRTRR